MNRKIQAYDTAKELNAKGRSSVVGMQVLKTLDFIFPEAILLLMLCFAFNFEIAKYFMIILLSFIFPVVGNIISDKRVRREAVRKEQLDKDILVNDIVNAMQSSNNGNGSNEI